MAITFGYASDIGKIRNYNDDAVHTFFVGANEKHPDFGLFIVCDGMGSNGLGATAAGLAIQQLDRQIQQMIYPRLLKNEPVSGDDITQALVEGVRRGNSAIIEWSKQDPHTAGAGTCLTAVLVLNRTAYIAHVGDTRCYIAMPEKLEQLSEDHNMIGALIRFGHIKSREEVEDHPINNRPYRALGQMLDLDVDTYIRELNAGLALLLCTDGITGWLKDDQISEIIRSSRSPQHACDRLIAEANTRGGHDNASVIIISNDFPFGG